MIERPVLTAAQPAWGPLPVDARTAQAKSVSGPADADRARNETPGYPRGSGPAARRTAAVAEPFDPDRPTGPPPTFDVNVMEAEMQRRMTPDYLAELPEPSGPAATTTAARSGATSPNGQPATTDDTAKKSPQARPDASQWHSPLPEPEPAVDVTR
jgi:hypothetical protein